MTLLLLLSPIEGSCSPRRTVAHATAASDACRWPQLRRLLRWQRHGLGHSCGPGPRARAPNLDAGYQSTEAALSQDLPSDRTPRSSRRPRPRRRRMPLPPRPAAAKDAAAAEAGGQGEGGGRGQGEGGCRQGYQGGEGPGPGDQGGREAAKEASRAPPPSAPPAPKAAPRRRRPSAPPAAPAPAPARTQGGAQGGRAQGGRAVGAARQAEHRHKSADVGVAVKPGAIDLKAKLPSSIGVTLPCSARCASTSP